MGFRGQSLGFRGLGYGGFSQKRALIGLHTDHGGLGRCILKDFRKTAFRSSQIQSFPMPGRKETDGFGVPVSQQ